MRTRNESNWDEFFRTVSKCREGSYLPLLPITGSGFNNFFTEPKKNSPYAICSWEKLLLDVAKQLRIDSPSWKSRCSAPAILWEEMVAAHALASKMRPSVAEKALRQQVAIILNNELITRAEDNEKDWNRFLEQSYVSPITYTLNFDTKWIKENPFSWNDTALLCRADQNNNVRLVSDRAKRKYVIHIHGTTTPKIRGGSASDSIVLGINKYSHLVAGAAAGYKQFKRWERSVSNNKSSGSMSDAQYKRVKTAWYKTLFQIREGGEEFFSKTSEKFNWVTAISLQPIIFLGCSLSQTEWDLWLILVQRHRNLARINDAPPVFILKEVNDKMPEEQKQFWENPPLGIRVLWCKSWSDGWKDVLDITTN